MSQKVGVLFVHGMGAVMDDYAHDTIQEVRERISGRGLNREEIAWESVYWAPILAPQEAQLWVDLAAERDLNWAKLRKFFVNGFGNTVAYQTAQERPESIYNRIHDAIHKSLLGLKAKLGGGDKPLVVIAHWLGTVMISNYIWDRQRGRDEKRYGATPFERMETLAGLVTMGSNIPLFTLGCNPITSIDFPSAELPERFRKKAKWLNFYDADDVLGWPLKPLSLSYGDAVTEDVEVSVGNILTSWNPANHAAYWTHDSVIKPMAYLIASILDVA